MAHSKYQVKFKYHVNIILNEEGDEADAAKANLFAKEFLRRYKSEKFPVYYPPDDQPIGTSYFDSLFHGIDNSMYTVILLTPGFVSDGGWNKYCQHVSQFSLMGSEVQRFVPIALGIEKKDYPAEIRRSNIKVLQFPVNSWDQYEEGWNRISRHLFGMKNTEHSGATVHLQLPTWNILSDTVLTKLADQLGFGWENLALNLGVEMARIEQCQMSYPQNVHMQIFKTLWTWRSYHRGDEQEKIQSLHKALSVIQRSDLSEMIEQVTKEHEKPMKDSLNESMSHDAIQEDRTPATSQFVGPQEPVTSSRDLLDSEEPNPPKNVPADDTKEGKKLVAVVAPQKDLKNLITSSPSASIEETRDEVEGTLENTRDNTQHTLPGEGVQYIDTTGQCPPKTSLSASGLVEEATAAAPFTGDKNQTTVMQLVEVSGGKLPENDAQNTPSDVGTSTSGQNPAPCTSLSALSSEVPPNVSAPEEDQTRVKQFVDVPRQGPEGSEYPTKPPSVLEEAVSTKTPEKHSEQTKSQNTQLGSGDAHRSVMSGSKRGFEPTAWVSRDHLIFFGGIAVVLFAWSIKKYVMN